MAKSHYLEGDVGLDIARGLVVNTESEHKFGAVPAMSQNTTGTIWDVNDTLYPWTAWDTPGVLTIDAVNASDDGYDIRIYGLDADFNAQEEVITVSSSGSVTGTKVFARAYRAYFVNHAITTNVGDVTIKRAGTIVQRILAGRGQTLMAIYTVPVGYTAYLIKGTASVQAGADASVDMFARYLGIEESSFRVGHSFEVSGTGGQYTYEFGVPLRLPEKTDIDIRATVRSNNARVSAAFDLVLVRN